MKPHPIEQLLRRRLDGKCTGLHKIGIYSACTANELVIEACVQKALECGDLLLVEATANQVNQYGGYTGMKPVDFAGFVYRIADRLGLPRERIVLGGDHLGPLAWTSLTAEKAMIESRELIRLYVQAGFSKIHIDTSMYLADDDKSRVLDTEIIASRAVDLALTVENAYAQLCASGHQGFAPVYVIGSEVPIPGGAVQAEVLRVTSADDFESTVNIFERKFIKAGLGAVWDRVIAVVVQPGVEFGDETIHVYDRKAAKDLIYRLENFPGLVFEGHSTDYQQAFKLKEMVQDGIALLKVGPALTFALREGLFALESIEKELFSCKNIALSHFSEMLEKEMIMNPEYWKKHYHGTEDELRLKRKFSYSDRCRYYLPFSAVTESIERMFCNFNESQIPDTMVSQFMPNQYAKVRSGEISKSPRNLVLAHVEHCLESYVFAVTDSNT